MVTARNTEVATVMDCVQPYDLDVLSNEEALSLFAQNALGEPNFDSHPRFRLFGEDIIKKCGRLPLALRALGRVLGRKTNVKEWEDLLNNEIWNSSSGSKILPALELSYYDLPPHLKQMFAYCSLFPKDYMYDKDELILLWMAEGFLNPSNGSKSIESLGRDYFEELKSRSFFQQSINGKSQHTMHDLINELATSVAFEFFFRADDKMGNDDFEKFCYFSFNRQEHRVIRKLKALHRARRLRTFLALQVGAKSSSSFSLLNKVLAKLVPHLQYLRVLSLANYAVKEVPQSIGSLKHIRYLNFSHTYIRSLPEVTDLYNLQSLLVCNCYQLSSLPHSFVKLINLRHLDNSNTPMLNKMPLGIGGLTSLQTLSKVIIEEANGFTLSELKGLSDLHGKLSILRLDKVISAMHANEAKLHQKEGIDNLDLVWSESSDGSSQNEQTAYKVLEELRPHGKLRKLSIVFFNGTRFPTWVGDPSFDQLTKIILSGCRSCTRLPTLGHLGSLRKLFVEDMDEVKTLDTELLGPSNSCHGVAFPSLEVLEFKDMQGWDTWSAYGGDNNGTTRPFPRLREISIRNCPNLARISIELIPSVQVLTIADCSEVVLRKMVCIFINS